MKKIIVIIALLMPCLAFSQLNKTQVENSFAKLMNYSNTDFKQLFSASFLTAVPEKKITELVDKLVKQFGSYQRVIIKKDNKIEVFFEKAYCDGTITYDADGKIAGLFFGQPKMISDNINDILDEFKRVKGTVSLCIRKDGKEIISYNKEMPLGVGSSFKLFVLRTLLDQIAAGKHKRDEVVILDKANMSLPSGFLQSWHPGDPITVQSLANLMISISDNTATDHLIDFIGRENIEKLAIRNTPFFKTMDLFRLKLGLDSNELNNFCQSDIKTKRAYLTKIADIPNDSLEKKAFTDPIMIDKLEWFFTTEELCKIIETMKGEKTLAINAGLAEPKEWYYAGYKGGSEPGVLNYTHLLQPKQNGPVYSISATINDTKDNVDKIQEFTLLVIRFITLIQNGKIDK